jgi:hypothetical protein
MVLDLLFDEKIPVVFVRGYLRAMAVAQDESL